MDYTVHGILQARILEWVAFPFSRGSPTPGIKPRSPALKGDSLPAEPQGKPKNTWEDSPPFSSGSSYPGIQPGSPALQVDSLPTELSRKPLLLATGLYFPYPLEDCPSLIHCTMYHGHRGGHGIQQIWIWIWGSQKQWAAEVESPAGRALRMHHNFLLLRSCPSF